MSNTQWMLLTGMAVAGIVCAVVTPSSQTEQYAFTEQTAQAAADDSAAVAAVKRFLHAKDEHDAQTMYSMIAADGQKMFPYQAYANGEVLKGIDNAQPPLSEVVRTIAFLFCDVPNQRQYAFTYTGPDPKDPAVVLVNGGPAGVTQPMALRIFTVQAADGKTRLDLMKTVFAADPSLKQTMDKAQDMTCMSNLKQISLGILMYAQDHNEHFPDADKWVDEVTPYVKNDAIFHDPQDAPDHQWSYAFNKALSGKTLAQVAAPAETVMLFDSTTGTKNAADLGESLPHPGRHHGANVYALADGHVKTFQDGSAPAIHG